METEIIKIRPGEGPVSEEDEEKLRAAGAILQQGGLVAFPTETRKYMRQRADRPTTH